MSFISRIKIITKKIVSMIYVDKRSTWSEIEYFNPEWKNRIKIMSQYIGPTDSVVDFGCGEMWLKEFLGRGNQYIGVDYKKRDGETLVCDFNQGEYPNVIGDVCFVSGCLEYIVDYEALIKHIANRFSRCIISYCCIEDFSNMDARRQRTWVNDLSRDQVITIFEANRMKLNVENKTLTNNSIFVFNNEHVV